MRTIITITLLCCATFAQSQSTMDWNAKYGDGHKEHFNSIIEATNGSLVAVGNSSSMNGNGYLVIASSTAGETIKQVSLGGSKADGLSSVVQTNDGYFVLGGVTESFSNGKKDAWLLKFDEKGNQVWQRYFGTNKNDEIRKMVLAEDGNILAVGTSEGQKNDDVWIMKINPKEGTKVWEKIWSGKKLSNINAITATQDGGVAIIGNTDGDVWLAKANRQGDYEWQQSYGGSKFEEGSGIVATEDGGLVIAGSTWSKGEGKADAWLIKTDARGVLQWEKTYGGREEDFIYGITKAKEGGFILVGQTRSHSPSARENNVLVVKTLETGGLSWKRDYGFPDNENALAVAALYDASFVFAGETTSNVQGPTDAWIGKLGGSFTDINANGYLSYSEVKFNDDNNGILDPQESGYISFKLSNNSSTLAQNVTINIQPQNAISGVSFWDKILVGNIAPRTNKMIYVPIRSDANMQKGANAYDISIFVNNKKQQSLLANVTSKRLSPATFRITKSDFSLNKQQVAERGTPITFSLSIQNTGEAQSADVVVEFGVPKGINLLNSSRMVLGGINPQMTAQANLELLITDDFKESELNLTCKISESGQVKLDNSYKAKVEKKQVSEPPLIVANNNGNRQTPPSPATEIANIFWTSPDPSEVDISKISREENFIDIKLKTVTTVALAPENFTILVNGIPLSGSKFDEEDLSKAKEERKLFTQTYKNRVSLQKGENRIVVEVKNAKNKITSDPMIVQHSPQLPNLHVLAIGVTHEDLQYTAKDAEDFANAFQMQQNKLFNKVFITKKVKKEETTERSIKQAFIDLNQRFEDQLSENKINERDLVVIFISSHGKIEKNQFKILPSDYDKKYADFGLYVIDFKRDIIDYLDKMQCKRLLFVDACHSGAASAVVGSKTASERDRSEALTRLLNASPDISTITSCDKSQLSYEDARWQNGAFTESILEAFANKQCKDSAGSYKSDANGDHLLTITEIYNFLKRRVPSLVKEAKPDAPTSQTPFMPINDLDSEISVFEIN